MPDHQIELPLSFAQQRLWFLDQLDPNTALYNIPIALRLEGTLQVSALEQSLQAIIDRHEALRTNFITIDGEPTQIIHTEITWTLAVVVGEASRNENLPHLPTRDRDIATQQLVTAQAIQPFDLASESLIRATLVVLSETEHILLMCMHHIVSDGWSMGVLVQELAALYNAAVQGQPALLVPLPIQYADFAIWQREWLQSEVLESQLSYWQQQLAGIPALLSLPTDRPRPTVQTFAGSRQKFPLTLELTQGLTKLSQQQGVTLFMTLLAAFDILLYRYTGQADILVGVPIANRNRSEIEGLIGFFVNTVVMRTDLSGHPSFNELLRRVREMAIDADAHQDLPLEMLVEVLQPQRDLSHPPLFQVMFDLQNNPLLSVELTGLSVSQIQLENTTAKFDLTLSMQQTGTGLLAVWEYNTDLLDDRTIERLAGHFETMLAGIVANPQQSIDRLPLLSDFERHQLLVDWNQTQVDYPQDICVHQLFEQQVARTPEAIAVRFEDRQLTYGELNLRANQLAHYLQSVGVGADVLVGICVERSLDTIVGLLGILKAGGAYVPIDPNYPTERITYLIADSQLNIVLTQERLLAQLPEHLGTTICLDRDWSVIAQHATDSPITAVQPHHLAYIIYTSGSTGTPKGVTIEHRSLLNFVLTANREYGLTANDKILQFGSICFDISVEEIFPGLLVGATVVLRTEEMLDRHEVFWQRCQEWQLTVLSLSTAYWHQLVAELTPQDSRIPPQLRMAIIGGEEAQRSKVEQWDDSVAHFANRPQLVNGYGPTEATVVTTLHRLNSSDATDVLIGRPISNTQVYILDRYLEPVPIGVAGELHIGGAGLSRGYLHRPELTTEKFIPNPFNTDPNSRLYKTGDLARYLPDGKIEYLGRIDNQVKIRGFRIELGEIETVLSQHRGVKTAIVIASGDTLGEKRLVAYIVPDAAVTLTVTELRQVLKAKLPAYMVPSAVVLLESLPLTVNGKVDRRALPAPDFASQQLDNFVAPRTPAEEILAQIWAKVLKVERVGIHDNFFEIGGHSLLATQLVSRVRTTFKVELPLRELFATGTVAALTRSIQQLQQQDWAVTLPAILPRATAIEIPLSFAQTRLWFLDRFEPNSSFYNIPLTLRLVGTLDRAALAQSLAAIVDRHEALRTNFVTVEGVATQAIQPQPNWQLSVVDLQHLPIAERDLAAQELAQHHAIQPFDLTSDCLFRATLVIVTETEHRLLVCVHHIVADGWSIGVLLQELTLLYNTYGQDLKLQNPLTPLSIQFADFAIWQRQWLQGEVLQQQLSYWQQQLAGIPALLSLPTDRPRPAVQTFAGAHHHFDLTLELTQKLTQLSQEQGVTLFMTLLAAYNTLLYRYTEQSDIVVGTPIANRNRSEIEGLIGFFVNTLVLRTDLSGDPSFSELLLRVRSMAMDAYAHQDLPFEMLVETLQPERDLSHSPLFQVDFVLQNEPLAQIELTGLTVSQLSTANATAKFDLTLGLEYTETGLRGGWEYNTDLFDRRTIERLAGHFVTMLEAIVTNPQTQISQLPMLTAVEQRQLLIEWNHTEVDYPHDRCIHQLFAAQVDRTPEAVAVVFAGQELTYQELNIRANQLAHYLQSVGVEPDVLVGIYLERSLDIVVGLLAVLKAGGAYVPLDPDYPHQRLVDMAADAQISVLLTQQALVNSGLGQGVNTIVIEAIAPILTAQSQANPVSAVSPENLLCLLYTSGSTGKPKGVMLTHQALVNHSCSISEVFGLTSADRVLQFASFGFDVAAEEIFPTWLTGGTVVLRPAQMFATLADFGNFIDRERLSVLNITPAYWHEWAVAVSQSAATVPTSLSLVAVGGDAVLPETVTIWQEWVGDRVNCLNVYGPTEASVTAIVDDLLHPQSAKTNSVSIGRPIANTKAYILDRALQPVPVGVRGELHLCGLRLARGYLNRPELTAEKFIANPFSQSPFDRLYKTGDMARYLPDGTIECFGRIDNQVKIRGFRIELGEVEAVLNQHPDVQTCCAIVREDTPGEKYLVAYVVAQVGRVPMISELRQFLANNLPLYMVPQAFVFLDSLPLTTNRKVDRRALPAPDLSADRRDRYVAPRNAIEEMLSQIWTQVLKVESVGIYDNFFEIGGHSLLATQVVSGIRSRFNVEIPLRSLFAAATVAELAQLIGQLQQQDLALTIPPIERRTEDAELLLSFAQTRLWFLDRLEPNSGLYNIPIALRLVGTLDQAALAQSLTAICDRHEVLRTNFMSVDGQPTQTIHSHTNWTLAIVDRQQLDVSESIEQWIVNQANQPFDLANTPLIGATLVVQSDTEHILFVSMHHIISDGWSIGILVDELTALYNAAVRGIPPNLAPLPIQYADFALWQRQWLQGEVLQRQLSYWQQQLADAPALLSLPTDRPRPAVQTFTGAHQQFALSLELTKQLTALSQEQGVTLFMTLLAAFDTLLYRYTGRSDILVGSPIANRNRSEIEGLIGFFVNTLVMRTDLSENPSFSELLNRVREVAMDAYAHQDLPFEMLVEALQPQRDLSHSPLFQVVFLLQNAPLAQIELTGLTVSDLPIASPTAKFDLTLAMGATAAGLVGVWEYNTDLFDAGTIERLAGHFVTLLESIVANPHERICQLPMLSAVEQQQLLVTWHDTKVDYPQDLCIHQLFEAQVDLNPDAVAVVFEQQQLTYAELNCRANQLAHHLRSLGVGADMLVGICVERSIEMIVGILAIVKAGGAYVPLDPEYPRERLQFIIEDAQVYVLLTQERVLDRLPAHQAQLICWEHLAIDRNSQDNPVGGVTAGNLANLIYTSGSTGQPKGVMVEHRGLFNLAQAQIQTFDLDADARVLQFASLSFDASIWEILMAVSAGATLYLGSKDSLMPGQPLIQLLKDDGITHITLPPSVLAVLPQSQLPALQTIIVAGEACAPELIAQWAGCRNFFNAYGPTETSVCATVAKCTDPTQKISIGRPIANTQIYILDSFLQPVPIGVPGELHIGGMGLARGYFNRPELTMAKFIPDPFSDEPNSRLYKTGDLARYLPDGKIEYLGRIDNQVKIRGFRIELGEIEAALSQLPEVREAIAIARVDESQQQRLVAYVVPQQQDLESLQPPENLSPDTLGLNLGQSLRSNLQQILPDYMVPSAVVILESLPLTPNGKIDRRALPAPDFQSENQYIAPRNAIEEQLALIWAEVLKLERVGIHANFFAVGGHSLLATQVISRAQTAFGVALPLRYLFESPTISQLGTAISQQLQTGSSLGIPAIVPVDRTTDIPLSWAQERLWFMNQLEGESSAYTIDFTIRLVGDLNIKALEQAFTALVDRHEPLRTQFKIEDNKPVQSIAPSLMITLPVVDLQPESDPWQQVQQLAAVEVSQPFDLADGQVLRVKLWQVAPDDYVLAVAIHHIAADGWSLGILIDELSAYYRSFVTGNAAGLPDLPVQYADFAVWQRQWLTDRVLERQLSYWKQQLTDVPSLLALPTDRPRPAIQTFRGGTAQLQLDPQLSQQLKQLSQESGGTLFMTLLAGFVVLMSRYSGQTDLVIGSPIANRNRTEIESLIGFFVNTLALRFDLSQSPSFAELLAQVRQVTQAAYDHQDLPFEMLVEELQLERHLDRNPLTQVAFALQNAPTTAWDLPGIEIADLPSGLDSVRSDLELFLWDAPAGLRGFCAYNRDLFDGTTIDRLLQHFQTLLAAIVDNPQQSVALLPLLAQPERDRLLQEWNDTHSEARCDKCIHHLVEEQVQRTPDAVAVVFEGQQLTYAELNSRANQLAHYLQSQGVSTEVLVGICLDRSLETIVALLAILKAGGAYVPLDPNYPQERLSWMLTDTQVPLLLTTRSTEDRLPPHSATLVFVDEIWSQITQTSQENLTQVVTAANLANVIYTSGSTGKPKGVMVEHRGLSNLAQAQIQTFGVNTHSRVLQFASFSFDACSSEILMALGAGATLYLAPPDALMPGTPLLDRLREHSITHITLPPSALAVLPRTELPALQTLIVAGEACSIELVKQWSIGRKFFNAYGPTEASVCATIATCTPNDTQVTIGRPIANVQVYLLDSHLQPVPIGVPGELYIAGIGVARGYLNRPELTPAKFIPNPFGGSKLYQTGDLARYLPDGSIEYLGRIDSQVKVRGFRIELGEIEAVLSQHPLVQSAVVIARPDNPGDNSPTNLHTNLVAYLVPDLQGAVLPAQLVQWQSEYVSDWQKLYEESYSQTPAATADPTFNISGWNSSYTGQPIPAPEMQEWVDNTVSRILAHQPQRVLEIGCGSGLILFRVAQHCQTYWGADYSLATIRNLERLCQEREGLDNVRLLHQPADNFEQIPPATFDTVIINSVVQYFPSVEYLLQVLDGAMRSIEPTGKVFIGDVRSLPLLEPYHAAVQLARAESDRRINQWQQQVHQSIAAEEELAIDPQFFIALTHHFPQITWVEIQPKQGQADNELTQFRYDVTLHLGTNARKLVVPWLNWQLDRLSYSQLQHQLMTEQPAHLGIRDIPNQRVQPALQILDWLKHPPAAATVGELKQRLAQQPTVGIHPDRLCLLGAQLGYSVRFSWWKSSQDGAFDVVFARQSSTPISDLDLIAFWQPDSVTTKPWADYTNNPLYGKLVQKLVPQVRELSQQQLPSYMVPQAFVLLDAMPLTPNGKVDRRALPTAELATRNLGTGFVSPQTPIEAQLVRVWSEVLGIERIGIKDNFFELGGHSLLATQVISRLRDLFAVELSLQNLLEYPTIANLAHIIEILLSIQTDRMAITKPSADYEEGEL